VVIVRGDVRVDVNFELTLSVALVQHTLTIAHATDVVMCCKSEKRHFIPKRAHACNAQ